MLRGRVLAVALALIVSVVMLDVILDIRSKCVGSGCVFSSFAAHDVHRLARVQSDGFFDNIDETSWELLRERVRRQKNRCVDHPTCLPPPLDQVPADLRKFGNVTPQSFYQDNWEPDFTCLHERRMGGHRGLGEGGKWVCDPHRIAARGSCLVYSIGSAGDYSFEAAIRSHISAGCEIHTFDPADYSPPSFVTYHRWGVDLVAERGAGHKALKTMKQTVEELGHVGRTIDIFKIDCEGCEWKTFRDWLRAGVVLRQILVEVHLKPPNPDEFFETLQEHGYVVFHKEPNIKWGYGCCVEFAFLKLGDSFFAGMDLVHEWGRPTGTGTRATGAGPDAANGSAASQP